MGAKQSKITPVIEWSEPPEDLRQPFNEYFSGCIKCGECGEDALITFDYNEIMSDTKKFDSLMKELENFSIFSIPTSFITTLIVKSKTANPDENLFVVLIKSHWVWIEPLLKMTIQVKQSTS